MDALHAQAQHLGHQHRAEAVHRQTREAVRLSEDDPAAEQVLRGHHALAVVPGVLHPALPKGVVKAVVGVAGEQPAADKGVAVIKSGAQICALTADDVRQAAVLHGACKLRHLSGVHPGVARLQGPLALGGDMYLGIGSFCLHNCIRLSKKSIYCSTFARRLPYK